jgi:hypothetical protein
MINIVIPYIHSIGIELKYCIASLEKYGKGINKIWVVGDKPKFPCNHIPCERVKIIDNKAYDIWNKVLTAANSEEVTEDFIYCSDDVFLTKETDFANYKTKVRPYPLNFCDDGYGKTVKCTLNDRHPYRKIRAYATKFLQMKGYPVLNYDAHYPMPMNKEKVKEVSKAFNWKRALISGVAPYVIKSCYGNFHRIPAEQLADNKINFEADFKDNPKLKKSFYFSVGNFVSMPETIEVFEKLYGKKKPATKKEYKAVKEKKEYD